MFSFTGVVLHVLARAQLFTPLALSIGFSHNWLCQRFTNANTRLLATHLEFSSLFKSTTWAAPVFFTSHSPRAAPGGCPCFMSLIDTMRDTAQDEQIQSQSVTPIHKYIVLLSDVLICLVVLQNTTRGTKTYNDHQQKIAYPAYPAGFRLKPCFIGT